MQSFSDDSTPKCPTCGTRSKKNISKVFGAVGISFKGDGFYKNDHAKKGKKSSSSSSSSKSSEDSSSSSSESSSSESSSSSSSSSSDSATSSKAD
ncbi:MAG: FmdB family zinc ribbon protein [Acidimicrobiales bacterium]